MVLMIFRFFLQTGEFVFFSRRLKNVAMTKLSLKQLRSNENILNKRHDGPGMEGRGPLSPTSAGFSE